MNFYIFVNVVLLIVAASYINGQDEAVPEPVFKILPYPLPRICPRIACRIPECALGYTATQLPTECCPSCKPNKKPDCSTVRCAFPNCTGDQKAITLAGSCCQTCVLDCSDRVCLACVGPTAPDQCCPSCGVGEPVEIMK